MYKNYNVRNMENDSFVKIPISMILGKKKFTDEKKYIKVRVNNLYNLIDKNNNFLSEIWLSKIDGDFINGEVIVRRKDDKYNVLKEDGTFLFNEWMISINEIGGYNHRNLNSYIVQKSKNLYNIYDSVIGFVSDELFDTYYNLENGSYYFHCKNGIVVYNIYTHTRNYLSDVNFITKLGRKLFIVYKEKGDIIMHNLVNLNCELMLDRWLIESPKGNYYSCDDCNVIICGDSNTGYYLLNGDGEKLNDDIYDKFIVEEYSDGKTFNPINKTGFLYAYKNDKIVEITQSGNVVDSYTDKEFIVKLLSK